MQPPPPPTPNRFRLRFGSLRQSHASGSTGSSTCSVSVTAAAASNDTDETERRAAAAVASVPSSAAHEQGRAFAASAAAASAIGSNSSGSAGSASAGSASERSTAVVNIHNHIPPSANQNRYRLRRRRPDQQQQQHAFDRLVASEISDVSESIEFFEDDSSVLPRLTAESASGTTAAAAAPGVDAPAVCQALTPTRSAATSVLRTATTVTPSLVPRLESAPLDRRRRRISYLNPLYNTNHHHHNDHYPASASLSLSSVSAPTTPTTTTTARDAVSHHDTPTANEDETDAADTIDDDDDDVIFIDRLPPPRQSSLTIPTTAVPVSPPPCRAASMLVPQTSFSSHTTTATTNNNNHRASSLPSSTVPFHDQNYTTDPYDDDAALVASLIACQPRPSTTSQVTCRTLDQQQHQQQQQQQQRRRESAVQPVHRGSDQWTKQLRPFVSDLAFRSIATRRGRYTQYTSTTNYTPPPQSQSSSSLHPRNSVTLPDQRPFGANTVTTTNPQSNRASFNCNASQNSGSNASQTNNPSRNASSSVSASSSSQHSNFNQHIRFKPYTCQAAVLFVDISGYSRITAAIAHRGAHVISAAVNAYLSRLLKIIHVHGGDVVKFAGDAILVVWEGNEQELEINVVCAAYCAVQLQKQAGEHLVDVGTDDDLTFHIHCGLCCGPLDSEIFEAPVHENMQRLYHYVGGDALMEIGELVDLAMAGEICISRNCCNFIENGGTYAHPAVQPEKSVGGSDKKHNQALHGARLLRSLELNDPDLAELMKWHIQKTMADRKARRDYNMEEEFIHDNVLAYLSHGGLSPTHIAQMRNLCVLFIAMTSKGSSVNWLLEVQAILDKNRCPIVQIIHDDKGVHIVAAVNLYEAIPEASLVGIEVCRELIDKRVGACVGVALGPTFCGVTGSTTACRWDITGPVVVRAARLMQYAMVNGEHFAIDQSLYDDPMAATRMLVLNASVTLKGASEPIAVYTLSNAKLFSAFRILENVHGGVHDQKIQEIQNHISGRHRSAVLVTGIPLAGMTIVCQRAAGFSDLVPYLHLCEVSAGFLQLARTIATWFQYVDDREVKKLAMSVMDDMSSGCWSCAHDLCVKLVNVALMKNYQACFVVDRIHNLDKFSLSLIRECLQTTTKEFRRKESEDSIKTPHLRPTLSSEDMEFNPSMGQICFMCTHMSLYSSKSAADLVQDIVRSHTSFKIPIITLGEATKEELRTFFRDLADIEVEERWIDSYAEASGYSAEYFLERAEAVRNMSAELWKDGKPALFETSDDLILHIPPGLVRKNKELKVTQIRAEIAMMFSQIYDEYPPLCQLVIKIVTIASRRGFYKLPYNILWEVVNDLIAQGVEKHVLDILIDEMVELCILKIEDRDERTVASDSNEDDSDKVFSIQSPALADIAMDVCTPVQVRSIASVLIERLSQAKSDSFAVLLVVAGLHNLLDQEEDAMEYLWKMAYQGFLRKSKDWTRHCVEKWKEIIDDEIRNAGRSTKSILGDEFFVAVTPRRLISPCIAMLKLYSAPIALGPMAQSLNIIFRNTFFEYGLFHGAFIADFDKLQGATSSACGRYMMQISVVESQLYEMGVGAPSDQTEAEMSFEMNMISFVAEPAKCSADVETKALFMLEEFIPRFVEHRLQRLYKLVAKLKENTGAPDLFMGAEKAVRHAYNALQSDKSRMDSAQDALMILATMNWKPKAAPAYLPLIHQQTVANIRNATLKRLSDAEVAMFRHQQGVDDLEAFLIVTTLLQHASENGLC